MLLREEEIEVSSRLVFDRPFEHIRRVLDERYSCEGIPIRLVVVTDDAGSRLELGVLYGGEKRQVDSICTFRKRVIEDTRTFNAVMMVPTGIGAEIGGHAGDGCPAARLLAEACHTLVLHPNVVNASDLNEMPQNALYVEGSVLTRLMMGTIGLAPARSNRLLALIDSHLDHIFLDSAINSINAARASAGIDVIEVVVMSPPVKLRARHTNSGRAAGRVDELDAICTALDERRGSFDAVAFSSVIDVPHEFHAEYFKSRGMMVNPWGGVEAMFTHAISCMYNVPSAHSPMFESQDIANLDVGVVDPRMAAEAVSLTFLNCILKGLHRSPRIVASSEAMGREGVLSVEQISVLVQPDGCLGLPTLAALEQGITVIAVRENRNIMRNDLSCLPWSRGQFWRVENYWEAAGLMLALRSGIAPATTRRPLGGVLLSRIGNQCRHEERITL